MKLNSILMTTLGAICALSAHTLNASFEEASEYIDTDGTFVAYVDFEGDGKEIGTALNAIYNEVISNTPEMIPVPIDFNQLFTSLGFGSVRSMAWSSKELKPGLHKNTSVALMNGAPAGLFAIYGTEMSPFSAAAKAPTDASFAITANINLTTIRDTVAVIAQQIMGSMGDGILQQQLTQTVPGTEITVNEVIEALSGKIDLFWFESYEANIAEPELKAWVSFENAGSLLPRLKSLEENGFSIVFSEDEAALKATLENPNSTGNIYIKAPKDSGELIIYTDIDWTAESEGPRLAENPEFKALADPLPEQGLFFIYGGKTDIEPFIEMLEQFPEAAKYKNAVRMAADLFIGGFLEPHVAAVTLQDGNYVSEEYAGYSVKQAFMTVPTVFVAGMGSAMAIPAFKKVREQSQRKAIENNLRYINAAAQQYFIENGVTEVHTDQLKDDLARHLESIAGESYDLTITTEMEKLSVVLEDGTVISIDL